MMQFVPIAESTKVIFPPEPGRAVYCKSCLKKMKAEPARNVSYADAGGKEAPVEKQGMFGEEIKIENVSFHHARHDVEIRPQANPHKRKEVSLADLKKALDESLAHANSLHPHEVELEKEEENAVDDDADGVDNGYKTTENELREAIKEEKEMDEALHFEESAKEVLPDENPGTPKEAKSAPQDADKKIINPGEKITL